MNIYWIIGLLIAGALSWLIGRRMVWPMICLICVGLYDKMWKNVWQEKHCMYRILSDKISEEHRWQEKMRSQQMELFVKIMHGMCTPKHFPDPKEGDRVYFIRLSDGLVDSTDVFETIKLRLKDPSWIRVSPMAEGYKGER